MSAAGAAAISVSSARQFRHRGTTLDPSHPEQASELVTSGPNSRTRNPMYLGLTGLLAANALRRGSLRALLPLSAFVVYLDRVQIPAEEAALAERFGADYEAYRARVPRWVDRRSVAAR